MTMSETFKNLPTPAVGQDLMELGKITERLRSDNTKTVEELAQRLEPLARTMAGLTEGVSGAMMQMGMVISNAREFMHQMTQSLKANEERVKSATKDLTLKLWATVIIVSLSTSAIAVSVYCVWQRAHSEERAAAQKWHTFEDTIFPKLDKRTREAILQTWK